MFDIAPRPSPRVSDNFQSPRSLQLPSILTVQSIVSPAALNAPDLSMVGAPTDEFNARADFSSAVTSSFLLLINVADNVLSIFSFIDSKTL